MNIKINNFKQISELLKFDNEDEFYYCQILQRSKENPQLGNNNRCIKSYYIYSIEQLFKVQDEILKLLEVFNARAYIHLNRRNNKMIALELLEDIAHNIKSGFNKTLYKSYESVCGKHHSEKDKSWIIDADVCIEEDLENIRYEIEAIEPIGEKVITNIKTPNGYHVICKPFNSQKLKHHPKYGDLDIHKNNPTILASI